MNGIERGDWIKFKGTTQSSAAIDGTVVVGETYEVEEPPCIYFRTVIIRDDFGEPTEVDADCFKEYRE